jgi:hypothetical protein
MQQRYPVRNSFYDWLIPPPHFRLALAAGIVHAHRCHLEEPVMDMNCDTLQAQLAMLLRDQPRGVTADLTDFAVAYWDGDQVTGAYLRDNGRLDEAFDLDGTGFQHWHDEIAAWLANPCYTARPELLEWRKGPPPFDAHA